MGENKLAMIVLAGGASSRMGKEKSDLKLDGKSFLEIQIQKGRELGVDRIYVSGYRGAHCTEEIVMDRIKEEDLSAASKPVLIKQPRMERTGVLSLA